MAKKNKRAKTGKPARKISGPISSSSDEKSSLKAETVAVAKAKVIRHTASNVPVVVNTDLLSVSAIVLALATGIAVLLGIASFALPGGSEAVPAMGGVLQANVPPGTARWVFFLDTLFPIAFGSGLAIFATSFQSRGNRPLVRLILTALLVGVVADFSENALVFRALTGGDTLSLQWPITVVKYAVIAFAGVMMSAIVFGNGMLGRAVVVVLRYVFPILIAALVAGIGGRTGADIVGASFPLALLLLAVYANNLSASDKDQG